MGWNEDEDESGGHYGHRDEPAEPNNRYVPDQDNGCIYVGSDEPGLYGLSSGDDYFIYYEFIDVIIDTCNDAEVVAGPETWDMIAGNGAMNTTIENLKRRKIQVYEIQAGPELVKITVETPKSSETRVGVTVPLDAHAPALDSAEVDVMLLGPGHFNAVAFPRAGALPELRIGQRAAVAAFKFEAVVSSSRARGLELNLHGRRYQVEFRSESTGSKPRRIPSSVAKLLPKSWAKAKSK